MGGKVLASVSAAIVPDSCGGESLTLYLLLGTTCLPLLDTGSLHPHPNVKTSHIRVGGQKPSLTPLNNQVKDRQLFKLAHL